MTLGSGRRSNQGDAGACQLDAASPRVGAATPVALNRDLKLTLEAAVRVSGYSFTGSVHWQLTEFDLSVPPEIERMCAAAQVQPVQR